MSKVLVVGGSGFIGTRLLRRNPSWANVDLQVGLDFNSFSNIGDYDVVVLLAARHLTSTQCDFYENLSIYHSLVRQLHLCGIAGKPQPHVIFASSAAVYGPMNCSAYETSELAPLGLYGSSKVVGEQIIQAACDRYTILRFSNVYGDGDGHGVIDRFIRGNTIIYGDGENVRDYIHVDMITKAIEKIIEKPGKFAYEIINVSSCRGRTVNEVWAEYGRGRPEYVDGRTEVASSILNNSWAKELGLL